jgi:hypothetical protein
VRSGCATSDAVDAIIRSLFRDADRASVLGPPGASSRSPRCSSGV